MLTVFPEEMAFKGKGGALRRDEVSQGLERAHWIFVTRCISLTLVRELLGTYGDRNRLRRAVESGRGRVKTSTVGSSLRETGVTGREPGGR